MSRMKKELFLGEMPALSFDDYLKWGSKETHDALLDEVRHEIGQLDTYIQQREEWWLQAEADCQDRNMYEMSLRHHNILCCWDFERRTELELNGESIDLRRYIALLACAPISETYREDCEKFLAFAKSGRDGFSPEEIGTYILDIRQYIYLPMLEQEDVPDEARNYYYDLLLELEKLKAKKRCPRT